MDHVASIRQPQQSKKKKQLTPSAGGTGLSPTAGTSAVASAARRAATKTSGGMETGTSAIRKGSVRETWKLRQKRGL